MTGIVAVFAVLLVWNYMPGKSSVKTLVYSIEDVNVPETAATDIQLILAGNETVSLEGKDAEIAYKEDGIEINGQGASMKKEQTLPEQSVTSNQLIVPKGKRSMLSFAEGSRIWVNAGTRIVYPAVFDKKKREIYVDGEAYLEVSRNEDCPFLVKTKDFNVEVLGTSFNIMAYETDTVQNVVLVSGIVKILAEDHKQETVLSPNEMYANSKGSSEVKTVDVEDYISWKSGIYRYDSENLGTILKRLSRYYGQEISCGPQSAGLKCSGKLDLKDELETVLNGIAQTAPVVCQYSDGKYVITNQ
jgi:ferric-dicitrate binding protein FerR (iron transport regulator)